MARPDAGASFEPVRLDGSGRRPGIALAAWGGVLVLIVGVALANVPSATPGGTAPSVATSAPDSAAADAALRPRRTDMPPALALDVQRAGDALLVHGDLHSVDAVWVFLSAFEVDGRLLGWRSLDIATGSTAFRLGPVTRFDAVIELPEDAGDRASRVQANAYNSMGRRIESVYSDVTSGDVTGIGARPGVWFPALDANALEVTERLLWLAPKRTSAGVETHTVVYSTQVARVELALLADQGGILERRWLRPSDPGALWIGTAVRFDMTFDEPARTNGAAWVRAVAFDRDGLELGRVYAAVPAQAWWGEAAGR